MCEPDGDHEGDWYRADANSGSFFGPLAITEALPVPSAFITTISQVVGASRSRTKRLPSGANDRKPMRPCVISRAVPPNAGIAISA